MGVAAKAGALQLAFVLGDTFGHVQQVAFGGVESQQFIGGQVFAAASLARSRMPSASEANAWRRRSRRTCGYRSLICPPVPKLIAMGDFDTLYANLAEDPQLRGMQFEHVCKWFLENDPVYAHELKIVWLWSDWPGRWGRDAGIDLVTEDRNGDLWAIQAKA